MISPISCVRNRVILKGQHSSWSNVEARVPRGSIIGLLFFLIYVSELSDGLTSNLKSFADDTSLFSVVETVNSTANNLNNDSMKTSDWALE